MTDDHSESDPVADFTEMAPPRMAWGRRLMLVGVLLLGMDFALNDLSTSYLPNGNRISLLERLLAEQVRATGEVFVVGSGDERVMAAIAPVKASHPGNAGLDFIGTTAQTRKYEAWATAGNRIEALKTLDTLLVAIRDENKGRPDDSVQTFVSAYVPPVMTPSLKRRAATVIYGLLIGGIVLMGFGWALLRRGADQSSS